MRFGESFPQGADPRNRLDILHNSESGEALPSYVQFGLEIRRRLQTKVEKEGWPDMPDQREINQTEDIFESAKNQVDVTWEAAVSELIVSQAESWKESLQGSSPEQQAALELLNNPEELKDSFSLRQFGVLETLRSVNPEAWRSLVLASSERQLASVAVLDHWLKTGTPEQLEGICKKIGLSLPELRLFVDLAAILGKYIDQAYVKQIELADSPGGSAETKLKDDEGAQYLYDLYKAPGSEEIDAKTYAEIFPFEWGKIKSRLQALAEKTKLANESAQLPPVYRRFADYLEEMAAVYGSTSISPEVLDKKWDELYAAANKLNEQGCPIMLIPQGCSSVAGEAEKVDVEMRLGIKTEKSREQAEKFQPFIQIAQDLIDRQQANLAEEYKVPEVVLNYQPWAFGPNLHWLTRGESEDSFILSHTNAVAEVAVVREKPLLEKTFPQENINEVDYSRAATTETGLHEIGHSILSASDRNIQKKIGTSFAASILEELKADTVSFKILNEAVKTKRLPSGLDIKNQVLAKLGTCLDYLKNKSSQPASAGEPYYLCGTAIIGGLLDKGLLKKSGGAEEVVDPQAALESVAALGDKVLSFYTNSAARPSDVKDYIKELRAHSGAPELQEFIKKL